MQQQQQQGNQIYDNVGANVEIESSTPKSPLVCRLCWTPQSGEFIIYCRHLPFCHDCSLLFMKHLDTLRKKCPVCKHSVTSPPSSDNDDSEDSYESSEDDYEDNDDEEKTKMDKWMKLCQNIAMIAVFYLFLKEKSVQFARIQSHQGIDLFSP